MIFHFSKLHIALGLAGAVTSFAAGGLVMHSRALPVSAPPVAAATSSNAPQASARPALRAEARIADRAGPRGACRQDVQRLCGGITPGGGRIVRCLAEHRSEVSEGCRTAMQQRRMERQQQRQAMPGWRQTNGVASGEARPQPRMQSSAHIISVPHAQPSIEE